MIILPASSSKLSDKNGEIRSSNTLSPQQFSSSSQSGAAAASQQQPQLALQDCSSTNSVCAELAEYVQFKSFVSFRVGSLLKQTMTQSPQLVDYEHQTQLHNSSSSSKEQRAAHHSSSSTAVTAFSSIPADVKLQRQQNQDVSLRLSAAAFALADPSVAAAAPTNFRTAWCSSSCSGTLHTGQDPNHSRRCLHAYGLYLEETQRKLECAILKEELPAAAAFFGGDNGVLRLLRVLDDEQQQHKKNNSTRKNQSQSNQDGDMRAQPSTFAGGDNAGDDIIISSPQQQQRQQQHRSIQGTQPIQQQNDPFCLGSSSSSSGDSRDTCSWILQDRIAWSCLTFAVMTSAQLLHLPATSFLSLQQTPSSQKYSWRYKRGTSIDRIQSNRSTKSTNKSVS